MPLGTELPFDRTKRTAVCASSLYAYPDTACITRGAYLFSQRVSELLIVIPGTELPPDRTKRTAVCASSLYAYPDTACITRGADLFSQRVSERP